MLDKEVMAQKRLHGTATLKNLITDLKMDSKRPTFINKVSLHE